MVPWTNEQIMKSWRLAYEEAIKKPNETEWGQLVMMILSAALLDKQIGHEDGAPRFVCFSGIHLEGQRYWHKIGKAEAL